MPSIHDTIAENLTGIRRQIESACERSRRSPDAVTLVAVTKYAEREWVDALVALGQTVLGESRPQQLVRRAAEMQDDIEWHLIGHLQRNKVDLVLPATKLIHSADSLRLLKRISSGASAIAGDKTAHVLLEVNVSGEESKDGFEADALRDAWPGIQSLEHLDIRGLMTMAPLNDDPESPRRIFRGLRELRDELAAGSGGKHPLPELSMGMSRDYAVAIEEGATLIRVGSGLFDGLTES